MYSLCDHPVCAALVAAQNLLMAQPPLLTRRGFFARLRLFMRKAIRGSRDWLHVSLSAQTHKTTIVKVECEVRDMATILMIIVVLMLLGVLPTWNHSRQWGYGPSGGLGLVLVILIVLMLSGRL